MSRFPKLSTIQSRLAIIFLAFLSLLVISVLVTFLSLEPQKQAASVGKENINLLLDPENSKATDRLVKDIKDQSISITGQTDDVVQEVAEVSNEKLAQLRLFQIIFLGAGLALLGAGWWVTRKSIVLPLVQLEKSARRIGAGDLNAPIPIQGSEEARVLGQMMDSMRTQILASRQDLQTWASTLENQIQRRTKELEALVSVSREINSHLSISEVFKSVTGKARNLSDSEVASLCLLDRQGKVLDLHSASGSEFAILQSQTPIEGTGIGDALRQTSVRPYVFQNCGSFCRIINPKYRASHLAASLQSENKVMGVLCIGSSQPKAFRAKIESVLVTLAGVAAVAIQNSRLYQQAEQSAMLEERQRLASEIHDGLLQTLSFLGIMVRWAKEQMTQGELEKAHSTLQQIERAEEQAEHEIRMAIYGLQDTLPTHDTLQEQLAALTDGLPKSGPPVLFEAKTIFPVVLPPQECEQVLRIVREALLNAQRHSQAEVIYLFLKTVQNEMVVVVQDQGIGFDLFRDANGNQPHFGIKIMQARAARLGGELMIHSEPGTGTLVQLRWTPALAIQSLSEE